MSESIHNTMKKALVILVASSLSIFIYFYLVTQKFIVFSLSYMRTFFNFLTVNFYVIHHKT